MNFPKVSQTSHTRTFLTLRFEKIIEDANRREFERTLKKQKQRMGNKTFSATMSEGFGIGSRSMKGLGKRKGMGKG